MLNSDAIVWAAGRVLSTVSIVQAVGGTSCTVARAPSTSAGCYRITFGAAHPIGSGSYSMFVTGINGNAYIRTTNVPTSTYFEVATTNTSGTVADTSFSFMVMNW